MFACVYNLQAAMLMMILVLMLLFCLGHWFHFFLCIFPARIVVIVECLPVCLLTEDGQTVWSYIGWFNKYNICRFHQRQRWLKPWNSIYIGHCTAMVMYPPDLCIFTSSNRSDCWVLARVLAGRRRTDWVAINYSYRYCTFFVYLWFGQCCLLGWKDKRTWYP